MQPLFAHGGAAVASNTQWSLRHCGAADKLFAPWQIWYEGLEANPTAKSDPVSGTPPWGSN